MELDGRSGFSARNAVVHGQRDIHGDFGVAFEFDVLAVDYCVP